VVQSRGGQESFAQLFQKLERRRQMARKSKKRNKAARGAQVGVRVIGRGVGIALKTLATLILIGVITGCIVVTAIMVYVMNFMDQDESVSLDDISLSYTTMFYAQNEDGAWEEIYRMSGDQNRIEVSLDQIPDYVQEAFIATEDKRFREHEGVDWLSTAKVTFYSLAAGNLNQGGGSTITQQLIKNSTGDDEVAPVRKLREIFRALQLERDYSKDEILESYLNIIFLGGRTYGIEAAAQIYFGCHAYELTVPQAASLAAMTKSPNNMRPDLYAEKNLVRRNNYVLPTMLSEGYITQAEYDEYIATPVVTVGQTEEEYRAVLDCMLENEYITEEQYDALLANRIVLNDEFDYDTDTEAISSGVTSYYIDTVIRDVISDLMEANNWEYDYAYSQLQSGGYRIYTCIDQEMQSYLEEKYCDWSTFSANPLSENENGEIPESAMVIMDYEGHILALVGGKGEKTNTLSFNRATMATRSPGSAIKPLASYGQALEYDMINWSTMLNDSAVKQDDEGNDWPSNYELDYRGNMTIVEALRISRNTIPVKILQQLTPARSLEFLRNKLGFTTLDDRDEALAPLGVGSLTNGVHLDELTAAFAVFGNGGYYYTPVVYERIEDTQGNLVLDNTPQKNRAFSEDTAYVMNRLLKVVCESGTGRQSYIGDMPVVGKTGTTSDYYDMSFVGLTPYYVAGVWTGYDTQATLPSKQMYDCDTIWANVMGDLHAGLEVVDFTPSDNVIEAKYCTTTGLLASAGCSTATGYYKANALPDYCDGHYATTTGDEDEDDTEPSGSFSVAGGDSPDEAVGMD
jgi:penicillin-binding protein 1A